MKEIARLPFVARARSAWAAVSTCATAGRVSTGG